MKWLPVFAGAAALLSSAGCYISTQKGCTPGASNACICATGDAGLQTCNPDGQAFGDCVCNGLKTANCQGLVDAAGQCVQCLTNDDCPTGQVCQGLSGTCQPPIPPNADAGPSPLCAVGAFRCSPDMSTVQECRASDGGNAWVDGDACGLGACEPSAARCVICVPGSTSCGARDGSPQVQLCSSDGTAWETRVCADPLVCITQSSADAGVRGLATCGCTPGAAACVVLPDGGWAVQTCADTGDTFSVQACWPTNVCVPDAGSAPYCLAPVCLPASPSAAGVTPAQSQCIYPDGGQAPTGIVQGRQVCDDTGSGWFPGDCTGDTRCIQTGAEQTSCLTPCQAADLSAAGQGCDFWAAVLSNSSVPPAFTGDGTGASDFALVVSNPGVVAAHATVADGQQSSYASATIDPGSTQAIQLPWREICGTGEANVGYHLVTDQPVVAYQFNPLHTSLAENISCVSADQCLTPALDACVGGECLAYSSSNEASLLIPTHALGSSYVAVAQGHQSVAAGSQNTPRPGLMAVMATQDATLVQVQFAGAAMSTSDSSALGSVGLCNSAAHATHGSVSAQAAGSSATYALNQGDVLQFWTATTGTPSCISTDGTVAACLWPNDFTGTAITSLGVGVEAPKPIAVFGGADRSAEPYQATTANHMEEEMPPVSSWDTQVVGVMSHRYPGATRAAPQTWRLVSSTSGPAARGTTLTITPPIAQVTSNGTAPSDPCSSTPKVTTCVLPPMVDGGAAPWLEFSHGSSFLVDADSPVLLVAYDLSAYGGATEGGPSLQVVPPVSHWSTTYQPVASGSVQNGWLNLAIAGDPDGGCSSCDQVSLDGVLVPMADWSSIPGTRYFQAVEALSSSNASHTATSAAPMGASVDSYETGVSLSYPAGALTAPAASKGLGQ